MAQYNIGATTWADADEDGWGAFYDCDDTDADISPDGASSEWISGVDSNCDGTLWLDPASTDDHDAAGTDDAANARPLAPWRGNYWADLYRGGDIASSSATLHDASDSDWWIIEVPPAGGYILDSNDAWWDIDGDTDYVYIDYDVYEADGTTPYEGYWMVNNTSAPINYLVHVTGFETYYEIATSAGYYLALTDMGLDADGDEYYTQDWDSSRDCDDSDASNSDHCYPFTR